MRIVDLDLIINNPWAWIVFLLFFALVGGGYIVELFKDKRS